MPVEVRELIIKATVSQDGDASTSKPSATNTNNMQDIVKACVEKILEIIRDKNGR